eukprot:5467207-Amphidinium_carterae.1
MNVLVSRLQGAVQDHLLLHIDMTKPDFDKTAKVDIGCRGPLQECLHRERLHRQRKAKGP